MKRCLVLAWALFASLGCKEADLAAVARFAKAQVDTAKVQLQQLRDAVLRYHMLKGSPPSALEDLVQEKLLSGNRLPLDPWGEPYVYTRRADGEYEISSKGPDRRARTDDDVTLR